MGKIGFWKISPLKNEIILTLVKNKGEMLDVDLFRQLQASYSDISKNVLKKYLFALEVEMIIDVERIRKTQNKITLRKDAPIDDNLRKIFRRR